MAQKIIQLQMRHLYFNLKDLFSNRKGFVILTSLLRFKNKSREFRENKQTNTQANKQKKKKQDKKQTNKQTNKQTKNIKQNKNKQTKQNKKNPKIVFN